MRGVILTASFPPFFNGCLSLFALFLRYSSSASSTRISTRYACIPSKLSVIGLDYHLKILYFIFPLISILHVLLEIVLY